MGAFVKLASDFSVESIVFFRNFFCVLCVLPLIWKNKISIATKKPFLHIFRAVSGLIAIYFFFYTATKMLLIESLVLINTNPLFIPLWMALLFHEKLSFNKIWLLILGFMGVIFIIKPGGSVFQPAALMGLGSGIFVALAMISVNKLSNTEPVARIMFYFFVSALGISAIPMVYTWSWTSSAVQWIYILMVGCFSFTYQYCITNAYYWGHPTKVSSMVYLAVVFSGLIGWILWQQVPDIFSLLGILLVVLCGILTINNHRKEKKRS